MFFALQLDRGNISQALSDNFLKDLKLNTNDYNTGQTIFLVSFLIAELPSQLVSKKLGPDRWIPIQMVSWSLVAAFQAFLNGRNSFFICRALLGLIEGGFIPDCILYLSYYYTGKELPVRLSWFWTAYQSTQVISAFMAYGILRLRGYHNMGGWRWLFAIEGAITGVIGIISYFYMPPSPCQTASYFRGKDGWFTEHEEKIMVNRILRDDPSKGDMHNRQALSYSMILQCLRDWHMWPIYILGLSWLIPNYPLTQYLTLQLKSVGFDTFQTNLLTIPA
jgi:MFS family permease